MLCDGCCVVQTNKPTSKTRNHCYNFIWNRTLITCHSHSLHQRCLPTTIPTTHLPSTPMPKLGRFQQGPSERFTWKQACQSSDKQSAFLPRTGENFGISEQQSGATRMGIGQLVPRIGGRIVLTMPKTKTSTFRTRNY